VSGDCREVNLTVIDAAGNGDKTLVAAVSGKKVRVLSCFLIAAGAVNVRFESGAGGMALTGWFETASALLNPELSGAVRVDGCLTYAVV
jgi:hypothetical protein